MGSYKKYSKEDQKLMAIWALDCAERVLPFFEKVNPSDRRPNDAIAVGRDWVKTGIFSMAIIRAASLGAHSAANSVKKYDAACFAAHAAGQAVATAHVPQHAYGSAYYALKTIVTISLISTIERVRKEYDWQSRKLPSHLRKEIMPRLIIVEKNKKISIKLDKSGIF